MDIATVHSNFRFKLPLATRWSDMDEMRHINNAVYLTYFEQSRAYYFQEVCQWDWDKDGFILGSAHLNYHMPLKFPDTAFIYARISKVGTKSMEMEYAVVKEQDGTEIVMTTGYTTLVMFDYKTNKSIPVPERIRTLLHDYEKVKF